MICIYEYLTSTEFLIFKLFPKARSIKAAIGEDSDSLIRRIKDHKKIDYFIFHLNLTFTQNIPLNRNNFLMAMKKSGVLVINSQISDISKKNIQTTCRNIGLPSVLAERHGDANELLIIKTNLNYGGCSEKRLTKSEKEFLWFRNTTIINNTWSHDSYLVCKRREVPAEIWNSSALVIEKYVTNTDNFFYRAYVFGNRLVISKVVDTSILKKMPRGITRVNSYYFFEEEVSVSRHIKGECLPTSLPEAIRTFCKETKLDFGAFDIVQDNEGVFYIIDVNTTPHWGGVREEDLIDFLKEEVS